MLAHGRLDEGLEIENERLVVRPDRKEPKGVRPPANIRRYDGKATVGRPCRSLFVSICPHGADVPIYTFCSPQGDAVGQANQQALNLTFVRRFGRWPHGRTPCESQALGRRNRAVDDTGGANALAAYQTAVLIAVARPKLGLH